MLNSAHTRFHADDSQNRKIGKLVTAIEPGMALVSVLEDGEEVVTPSTGTANEVFAGVAWCEEYLPTTNVKVKTGIATDEGIKLDNAVLGGLAGISVYLDGTAATVDDETPGSAGTVFLDGQVVKFHANDEDKDVTIIYRYNLSVFEAQALYGDGPYGQNAVLATRTVGVITRGWVFTNLFDPAANWAPNGNILDLKLGANGRFVRNGSGTTLSAAAGGNVRVISVPTEDNPFLGLYYNA